MSSKYLLQKAILSPSAHRTCCRTNTKHTLLKSNILSHQSRNYYHALSSLHCTSITESSGKNSSKVDRFNTRSIIASFSSTTDDDKEKKEKPLMETEAKPIEEEKLEFQAETRQLLDIVTHSLYTDKQVFLRELISNASDALEKLRHLQSANEGTILDSSVPLEIRIETDEANGMLTITDTGVGMTKEEMISNLGTIARSGSKAFVKQLAELKQNAQQDSSGDAERGIIGKFGVGFYSAFMVGDKVEVRSKYSLSSEEEDAKVWTSTGGNTFSLATLDSSIRQDRGTSIVIHVNEDQLEFVQEARIEEIIKKYSNFVNFPIFLNGKRVNTIEAIWAANPKQVTDEAYLEFYKFVANARDDPIYRLHLRFDAPLDIKALLFVPTNHTEKFGMGRMNPGVSLYSRKVLIENKCPDILPEWLRFLKGVIDSEDLPISISREKAQDSALITKIRKALTRRFLNFLANKAKKEPDDFKNMFFPEYGYFIKEGVCADIEFQEPLSKLLYWETSKTLNKELSSFDEYISRSPPEQKEIYYLCTASRETGFQSPYYEAFKKAGREVIFIYSAIDDFTLGQIDTYEGRKIISIEKGDIDLGTKKDSDSKTEDGKEQNEDDEPKDKTMVLSEDEKIEFASWFKGFFEDKVESVKPTNRLSSSPAMITNHESGAMRRMMKMVDAQDVNYQSEPLSKSEVEFNPKHEIIVRMFRMRETDPILAKVCAEQVYDNCLVAAGLMDDSRTMLGRLNDLLLVAIKNTDIDTSPKVTIPKDEFKVEDVHEVVEGEIVEPNDDKKDDTLGNDSTKIDFDGKVEKDLKEEESAEEPDTFVEDEKKSEEELDGKIEDLKEESAEGPDRFVEDEKLSEEELDKYMMMPEAELEQLLHKKLNKYDSNDYKSTKKHLMEEFLRREQQKVDETEGFEERENGDAEGNWQMSKDMEEAFDRLIKEKEEQEKAGKVYVDKETDERFRKIMTEADEDEKKEKSEKGKEGKKET